MRTDMMAIEWSAHSSSTLDAELIQRDDIGGRTFSARFQPIRGIATARIAHRTTRTAIGTRSIFIMVISLAQYEDLAKRFRELHGDCIGGLRALVPLSAHTCHSPVCGGT